MRLDTPRLPPLEPDEIEEKLLAGFGDGPILNIFRTLAHHPDLMRRWLVFGNHVLRKSTLQARERELVILRIGYLCRAGYEWGQHVAIGKQAGLSDDEIAAIAEGPSAERWGELDRALLQATDELHGDAFISDPTWKTLSKHLDTKQLMDLVFAVGQYNLVSMALNTLGVQPEPGAPELPKA